MQVPRRKLRFWNHIIARDNAHSFACLRLFSPRKYKSIFRGFCNAVSLPGDCHSTAMRCFAMTEYFVRNVTRVCLPESNSKIYVRSLCFSVQRTLCHCERSVAISRKGYLVKEWWLPNDCNDIKCVARNCIKCVRDFCFCRFLRRNLAFFTTVANYFGFVCGF